MGPWIRCDSANQIKDTYIKNVGFVANAPANTANSLSTTFDISGFKTITSVSASCGGYPGSTSQYAQLEKFEEGTWINVIKQSGAYVNDSSSSSKTDIDITKATQLRVTCYSKGGNATATTSSAITLSLST